MDYLLIAHKSSLVFKPYYQRGRQDYPNYPMSITLSFASGEFALRNFKYIDPK